MKRIGANTPTLNAQPQVRNADAVQSAQRKAQSNE